MFYLEKSAADLSMGRTFSSFVSLAIIMISISIGFSKFQMGQPVQYRERYNKKYLTSGVAKYKIPKSLAQRGQNNIFFFFLATEMN